MLIYSYADPHTLRVHLNRVSVYLIQQIMLQIITCEDILIYCIM